MSDRARIVLKAFLWRAVSTLLAFALARSMGLPSESANAFTLLYAVASTLLYLAYETAWSRLEKKPKNS